MPSTSDPPAPMFFDAGLFIAAILKGDARHAEARGIVEAARSGEVSGVTSAGILSETFAALTCERAVPRHSPAEAARAIRLLIAPPSAIRVLPTDVRVALKAIELAAAHGLTSRRVHDARHAAVALVSDITQVCTYDINDWKAFDAQGLRIVGPPSVLDSLRV